MPALAIRISYVGDLGWELHVPIEQGARLWDAVWEAGEPHGIIPAGIGVYGTTGRIEKGYRAFGFELDAEYDVVEADMAWGKVKDAGLRRARRRTAAPLGGPGGDHVHADRRRPHVGVGRQRATCSAASRSSPATASRWSTPRAAARSSPPRAPAPSVGKHLLMAYLPPEQAVEGQELAVEYMNERYPVTVAVAGSTPIFDPENTRIRS